MVTFAWFILATLGSAALLEGVFQFIARLRQWRTSGWRHFVVAVVSISSGVAVLVINQWRISPPPHGSRSDLASQFNASNKRSDDGSNIEDVPRPTGPLRDMPYQLGNYDRVIHRTLPRFRFRVTGFDKHVDDVTQRILIEVIREGSLESFQTIEPSMPADTSFLDLDISFVDDEDGAFFIVQDLNFDGYADFRYLTNHSVCCYEYSCYTYDKYRGSYQHNAEVSDIFSLHTHVEIEHKTRRLIQYIHCAPGDIKLVYQWDGFGYEEITGERCF